MASYPRFGGTVRRSATSLTHMPGFRRSPPHFASPKKHYSTTRVLASTARAGRRRYY
jgi:hypothetical protein